MNNSTHDKNMKSCEDYARMLLERCNYNKSQALELLEENYAWGGMNEFAYVTIHGFLTWMEV